MAAPKFGFSLPHAALPMLGLAVALALSLIAACDGGRRAEGRNAPGSSKSPTHASESAPEQSTKNGSAAPVQKKQTNVEVLRLRLQNFSESATYIGRLAPRERIVLRAEVEGSVDGVNFAEGQRVSKNTPMLRIGADRLNLLRDLTRSRLQLAEANFARDKQLSKERLLPPAELERSRSRRDAAAFNLELAEIELEKSTVRSPIEGVVSIKSVEQGEFAIKGRLLAEILDVSRMRAVIHIPERQIAALREDLPVTVTVDALDAAVYAGRITNVGLEANRRNRSFPVEVELSNEGRELRAGMLGRVRIRTAQHRNQLLVPRYAILERPQGRIVFVAANNRAQLRRIEIGAFQGEDVQVLSGLRVKDALVVRGQHQLSEGDPVRVVRTRRQSPNESQHESR